MKENDLLFNGLLIFLNETKDWRDHARRTGKGATEKEDGLVEFF